MTGNKIIMKVQQLQRMPSILDENLNHTNRYSKRLPLASKHFNIPIIVKRFLTAI